MYDLWFLAKYKKIIKKNKQKSGYGFDFLLYNKKCEIVLTFVYK